jgi:DNA segregation ATPase FtsK/SpoIIIE, S-DNA-T family
LSEPGVPGRPGTSLRPRSPAEPVRAGTPGHGDVDAFLGRRESAAGEVLRAGLSRTGALARSAPATSTAGASARPIPTPETGLEGSEELVSPGARETRADISSRPEAASAVEDAAAGLGVAGDRSRRQRPLGTQERLAFPGPPSRAYALPDLSLLDQFPPGKSRSGKVDPDEVARGLERTLASFGVDARVVRWETGPVVTRYELQPAPGVKVQKITSLQNDIALALAASSVRLEAPIPGKSAIGVELPNERPGLVHVREILVSEEFRASASPLTVAVGKAIAGAPIVADLVAMPHLMIAGTTGAGKSVAINSMIASILFRSTPEHVRLLMIDPKRVELTNYNGIPHLLSPVVTGPREAAAKLRWAIQEMESRYEMFAADGVRNIQAFNAQHPDRPLAYILIIIDELADLMMIAPAEFEEIICRLAQMTRAVGIHLLIATQRPSVDVITGLIKANIPSRIAFSVSSQVDSRTILDHPGAEKLLGRGDMLFSPIGAVRPTRVQGAFISDAETERLVQFWRAQGEAAYVDDLVRAGGEAGEEGAGADALLGDAARLIVRAGYASVSLLQRKMRIGYVRAARVVDQLEEKGIVGPAQGSSPREVLVGLDDLDRLLQRGAGRGSLGLGPWAHGVSQGLGRRREPEPPRASTARGQDARGPELHPREQDEPEDD